MQVWLHVEVKYWAGRSGRIASLFVKSRKIQRNGGEEQSVDVDPRQVGELRESVKSKWKSSWKRK